MRRSAPFLLVAVVVAVAGAILWLLLRAAQPLGNSAEESTRAGEREEARPELVHGERQPIVARPERGAEAQAEGAAPPKTVAAGGGADVAAGLGVLKVEVRDRATGTPVAAFRWSELRPDGPPPRSNEVKGHTGAIPVRVGEPVTLRVEAADHMPETLAPITLARGEQEREVRILLDGIAPVAGVELTVVGADAKPVTRLRLATRSLGATASVSAGAAGEGEAGELLWQRDSVADDGVYRLPDLRPGRYRLHMFALDADRVPTTDLPHDETVSFTGSERIPLRVQLEAGALLTVTARDAAGGLLGQDVVMRLSPVGGEALDVVWSSVIGEERKVMLRRGGVPAAAPATLAEPIRPGAYLLELRRAGSTYPPVERTFRLAAGEHAKIDVQL